MKYGYAPSVEFGVEGRGEKMNMRMTEKDVKGHDGSIVVALESSQCLSSFYQQDQAIFSNHTRYACYLLNALQPA